MGKLTSEGESVMRMESKNRGTKGKTLFVTGLIFYAIGVALVAYYEPMNEPRVVIDDGEEDTWDTTWGMMIIGGGTVVAGLGMIVGGAYMLSASEGAEVKEKR